MTDAFLTTLQTLRDLTRRVTEPGGTSIDVGNLSKEIIAALQILPSASFNPEDKMAPPAQPLIEACNAWMEAAAEADRGSLASAILCESSRLLALHDRTCPAR